MNFHKPTILLAELAESFRMGMSALAAHKLRSALTLLGVLIGVFSIIVVMTAMRVLRAMPPLPSRTVAAAMTVLRSSWRPSVEPDRAKRDNERHKKGPQNRAIRVSFMRLWRLNESKE